MEISRFLQNLHGRPSAEDIRQQLRFPPRCSLSVNETTSFSLKVTREHRPCVGNGDYGGEICRAPTGRLFFLICSFCFILKSVSVMQIFLVFASNIISFVYF